MDSEKKFPVVAVVVIIVIALLGWWIFSQNQEPGVTPNLPDSQNGTENSTSSPSSGGTATTTDSKTVTVDIKANNFSFDKRTITVNEGDTVRIVFSNEQGFHDFVIDEFDARTKQLNAGQTETIEFVADKTGTFEYYCSVGTHRAMGMKGNLIVE